MRLFTSNFRFCTSDPGIGISQFHFEKPADRNCRGLILVSSQAGVAANKKKMSSLESERLDPEEPGAYFVLHGRDVGHPLMLGQEPGLAKRVGRRAPPAVIFVISTAGEAVGAGSFRNAEGSPRHDEELGPRHVVVHAEVVLIRIDEALVYAGLSDLASKIVTVYVLEVRHAHPRGIVGHIGEGHEQNF